MGRILTDNYRLHVLGVLVTAAQADAMHLT
jgi:hypothetical protein